MDVAIDMSGTVIETERLVLRPWRESDLADFYAYASMEGLGAMAGWKRHESMEESKGILEMFIDEKSCFALEHKADRKVIGSLGLHNSWANEGEKYARYKGLRLKEIGYALSKDYWGRGLMPEAVRAVIDHYFGTREVDAFTCGHFVSNAQSRRVIEKCGFELLGRSQYYSKQLDKTYDDMKYILVRQG